MLAFFIVVLYQQYDQIADYKLKKVELAFALVLGFCMNLGYGLMRGNGFNVFYGSVTAAIVSFISLAYYCFVSVYLVKFLFCRADEWLSSGADDTKKPKSKLVNKAFALIEKNQYKFYLLVILAAWAVPFLFNFPGLIMYDTRNQVDMYLHIPNHHTNASVLLNENQYITQHHSVPHTILVGFLFDMGVKIFGTYDAGVFVYCLIQYAVMAVIMAYMFKSIKPYLGVKWTFIFLALFALHPFFSISVIHIIKDIYFCGLFVIYMLKYYELIRDPNKIKDKKFFFVFLLLTIGLIILRNNAIYTLLIVSAVLFFAYKHKKAIVLYVLAFMAFNFAYTGLLTAFDISPGSPREMLSVPFQQTAYYVSKYGDEVTEEEKEAISKVLDYEVVCTEYDPILSDPIKDTYNKYATTDDLINYFKVWFKMFLKHPWSYVESFIHLNYGYYYPGVKRQVTYDCYNSYGARKVMRNNDGFTELSANVPNVFQHICLLVQYLASFAPILCFMVDTGVFIWVWIFMILFIVRRFKEKKKYILYYIPYFAYIIFILVGPANGVNYGRYIMPFVFCWPLIMLPLFEYKNTKE